MAEKIRDGFQACLSILAALQSSHGIVEIIIVEIETELVELHLEDGQPAGRVWVPDVLVPSPGQYFLASTRQLGEVLPAVIFPAGRGNGWLDLAPPLPSAWLAGTLLHLRGPLGRGFRLPVVRRVALAALDGITARLRLLWNQALVQGAEVALFTRRIPASLPDAVEVLPLESLPDVSGWAEYLALDGTLPQVLEWKSRLAFPGVAVEALVNLPMPCGGMGECGVCSVRTRRGWKHACQDGPVFDLHELEAL